MSLFKKLREKVKSIKDRFSKKKKKSTGKMYVGSYQPKTKSIPNTITPTGKLENTVTNSPTSGPRISLVKQTIIKSPKKNSTKTRNIKNSDTNYGPTIKKAVENNYSGFSSYAPQTPETIQETNKQTFGEKIKDIGNRINLTQKVNGEELKTFGGIPPIGPAGLGRVASAVNAIKKTSQIEKLGAIGKKGVIQTTLTGAPGFVVNTKTTAKTANWLSKFVKNAKKGSLIIGAIMATIGTYPFAGFIKEEALQTLGFGINSALSNNDLEGAQMAIDEQKEILDPKRWSQIKAGIPYVNIVDKLNDFYGAARTKLAIDERIVNDKKQQIETGETDEQMWQRVRDEADARKEQERKDTEEYYKNLDELRKKAKEEGRKEDEKYWANIQKQNEARQKANRKAEEDYWTAYWKEVNKQKQNNEPSHLNFGLL